MLSKYATFLKNVHGNNEEAEHYYRLVRPPHHRHHSAATGAGWVLVRLDLLLASRARLDVS